VLIWSRQRCLFHRDVDGLADRPVVDMPGPLPAWRAREMLLACRDQGSLAGELRMALAEAGQHVPPGPDQAVALIDRAAERIAGGGLRLVVRPPAALALGFDPLSPQAHRMGGALRLPVADGMSRRAAALRLLQRSLSAATLPGTLAAVLAHPAGSVWRRDVPRPAGASDMDYAADMIARRLLLLVPDGPRDENFRLAWTLADSQPDAPPLPPLPTPPPPAPPPPPAKQVGQLSVHVTRPDGTPIEGADVAVDGLGAEKTDKDGFVHYGDVACRGYDGNAKKKGFSDVAGGTFKAVEGSGTVTEGAHETIELVLHPYKIISITGTVRGTQGTHGGVRGRDTLFTSTVDDLSLASNAPSIVVRGCHAIHLVAVTEPPEQPVTWTVEANENTDSPPSITADAKPWQATLASGKHGSFSVIGTAGENRIVWNIVFVWVKVDVAAAVVTLTGANFIDNGFQRQGDREVSVLGHRHRAGGGRRGQQDHRHRPGDHPLPADRHGGHAHRRLCAGGDGAGGAGRADADPGHQRAGRPADRRRRDGGGDAGPDQLQARHLDRRQPGRRLLGDASAHALADRPHHRGECVPGGDRRRQRAGAAVDRGGGEDGVVGEFHRHRHGAGGGRRQLGLGVQRGQHHRRWRHEAGIAGHGRAGCGGGGIRYVPAEVQQWAYNQMDAVSCFSPCWPQP
jgi:hypothetical protein